MAFDGAYAVSAVMGGKQIDLTAEVVTQGEAFTVTVEAPVVGKVSAQGMIAPDGVFAAEGVIRVLLKRIKYSVTGLVDSEGKLTATCETDKGNVNISGSRIGG